MFYAYKETKKPARDSLFPGELYRIRKGDTLSVIARRFGTTVANLRDWNKLRSNRIQAGQNLVVRTYASGSPQRSKATASDFRKNISKSTANSGKYLIRRGDTLGTIARRFGVTVTDLKTWNELRTSRIRTGKLLTVAPDSHIGSSDTETNSSKNPILYKIRSGDTLETIARRFGVTVTDLKTWNGLRTSRIRAGKHLTIYSVREPRA